MLPRQSMQPSLPGMHLRFCPWVRRPAVLRCSSASLFVQLLGFGSPVENSVLTGRGASPVLDNGLRTGRGQRQRGPHAGAAGHHKITQLQARVPIAIGAVASSSQ